MNKIELRMKTPIFYEPGPKAGTSNAFLGQHEISAYTIL